MKITVESYWLHLCSHFVHGHVTRERWYSIPDELIGFKYTMAVTCPFVRFAVVLGFDGAMVIRLNEPHSGIRAYFG